MIIAETGADMTRYPTAGHLASWAGTCPGSNESAGRVKSTHTRPGNPHLKGALGIAAMAAGHGHGTYFAARCRRIASREGRRAIVAVEHSMLIAIWHMLTNGTSYEDPGDDFYTRLNPDRAKNRALEQLHNLGYTVTLQNPGAQRIGESSHQGVGGVNPPVSSSARGDVVGGIELEGIQRPEPWDRRAWTPSENPPLRSACQTPSRVRCRSPRPDFRLSAVMLTMSAQLPPLALGGRQTPSRDLQCCPDARRGRAVPGPSCQRGGTAFGHGHI